MTVIIPLQNELDDEGITRIYARTKSRFERFEREKNGAKELIDILDKSIGIKLEYDPQAGMVIMPEGKFVREPEGGHTLFFFGKMAARMLDMQTKYGISPEEAFHSSMDLMKQVVEAYSKGSKLGVVEKDGKLIDSWETLNDLNEYLERKLELDEA